MTGEVKRVEFDLHVHTSRYSGCSTIPPHRVLRQAKKAGLHGIALTEHGIRWPDDELSDLIEKGTVHDLVVIPGQEVACYSERGIFEGEFLVFGYPRSLGSSRSVKRLVELVHGEGGVVIAAHPFKKTRNGRDDGFYGAGEGIYSMEIDGLEVEHPCYDEASRLLAQSAMDKLGVCGIGSSDAHDLGSIGLCRTIFERNIADVENLCSEIRAKRLTARGMPR